MTSSISIIAVISAAILCGASPLLAQKTEPSAEPSAVFIPQAKPETLMKTSSKRRRAGRTLTGKVRVPAIMSAGAKNVSPLPNSAASIDKTYGDWMLNCGLTEGKKLCAISQTQVDKGTKQRVFAIELRSSKDGSHEGTVLMPFGLKLETGVVIKVGDEEQRLSFSTCLAQGCLVPVAFPNAATEAIRKAKTFTVSALTISDNQIITFNVSLNGFGAAIERAAQFSR